MLGTTKKAYQLVSNNQRIKKKKMNEKAKRFSKQTVCHLGVTQGYPKKRSLIEIN